jgi:hypothetical protein
MPATQFPIISASKLDISQISITKPKKNKDGKLVAYMNYGETGFMLETPTTHTFGVGKYVDEKKGIDSKYVINSTQRASNGESEEVVNNYFKFLKSLDDKMIDWLTENSQTIMKESYTAEDRKLVAAAYKKYRIVKENKDKKTGELYPDSYKVGFQTNGDEKKGEVVTPVISLLKGKSQVEVSTFEELCAHVPKNCAVRMVIQPRIYILTDIAGVKFTARFMKVPETKKMEMPTSFRFTDEPDDTSSDVNQPVAESTTEQVEDSDAEVEEVEGEEEEEEEGEEYEEVEEEE